MSARIPKGVRWPALILSVAAAALAYLGVSLWAGADGVVRAVTRIGAQGFAAMLALSLVNYALRFVRWQLYLRVLGHAQPVAPSLCIYLAGFALTTTPGKAGEALRSVFLKPRGVPVAASMAAFFSERLSDLLAVVVLVVVGLGAFPEQWLLAGAGAGLVLALSAPLMLPAPWQRTLHGGLRRRLAPEGRAGRAGRAVQALAGVLAQARACHTPWVLLAAFGLSLVAWAAEAWAFHLVLGWLGAAQGMQFSSLVYSAGVLAGAISFLPGGLGGTEATMVGLLLWAGQSQAPAVAATLLIRLTTLWFAVLIGAVALAAVLRGERQRRVAAPHSACPA